MKKLLSIFIAGIMLISCCIGVGAALPDKADPLWDNIGSMTNNIYFISTSGSAEASITGKSGTTSITATLTVYKQTSSGGWSYVDSDADHVSGGYLGLKVDFEGEVGAYYKAEFRVSITRNGIIESETKTAYRTC